MTPPTVRWALVLQSTFGGALLASASTRAQAQVPPVRDPVVSVPRPAPRPLRILGVFDEVSGSPIDGVEVLDVASGTYATTTATGTVALSFLPLGVNEVRIRKIGYGVQTMDIAISATDTNPVTVVLKRVTELPAVVTRDTARHYISPTLRSFEDRMRNRTTGYFIDEATLRKEDGRPLGNVLTAHAPGAAIKQMSGSAMFLVKSPRCSNGGMPDVYIDGVPLAHLPDPRWPASARARRTGGDMRDIPIDLSQFQVSDLAGVEFYPDNATMPAQFSRTSAGCGVLMLWTRER
jgi:hypothetical protein